MSAYEAKVSPPFVDHHRLAGIRLFKSARQLFVGLKTWSTERSRYRETVAELSRLSDREREDVGIAGYDIAEVAKEAARAIRAHG